LRANINRDDAEVSRRKTSFPTALRLMPLAVQLEKLTSKKEVIEVSTTAAVLQQTRSNDLTTFRKCLFGGLGALTPIVISLLTLDLNTSLKNITFIVGFGYLVKVSVLFYVGGMVAYLHKEEKNPLKLFELGIVAPALILGVLNGTANSSGKTVAALVAQPASSMSEVIDVLIPTVYAQASSEPEVKTYSRQEETYSEQFWRGFTGARTEKVWFVIAGTHRRLEDARAQAQAIDRNCSGLKGEVYQDKDSYSVVIGANMTLDAAQSLKQKASQPESCLNGEDVRLKNPWAP
jgi:hypothetical protein